MSTPHPTLPLTPRTGLMALAAGLALGLAACDNRDATTRAVARAEIDFGTVAGGPISDAEYANQVYRTIESSLQSRAGKGPAGASEAASVLLAAAQQGLAATAAHAAAGFEHQVRSRLRVIHGQITEWSRLNALAEAAATYDPRPELGDIDEGLAATRRHLAEFEQLQRDSRARVADLTAQIEDLTERSAALRNEAGTLQLEMSTASAARAAELAPQARDLMDQSDALDTESQRVQTSLEQYLPEANAIELNINRINRQRELLTRSRTEVSARAQAAEEDERKLRAAADRASRSLKQLVSDLEQFRAQEVAPAFDAAASTIASAISNAQKARDSSRDAGTVTAALAQQAAAQLALRRSHMHLAIAEAYEALTALGVGPEYAELATAAREAAAEAHEAATSSFAAAASSLRSVRVQGDAADRLRASADLLERYAAVPLGQAPDLTSPIPAEGDEGFEDGWNEDGWDEEGWDEEGSGEEGWDEGGEGTDLDGDTLPDEPAGDDATGEGVDDASAGDEAPAEEAPGDGGEGGDDGQEP